MSLYLQKIIMLLKWGTEILAPHWSIEHPVWGEHNYMAFPTSVTLWFSLIYICILYEWQIDQPWPFWTLLATHGINFLEETECSQVPGRQRWELVHKFLRQIKKPKQTNSETSTYSMIQSVSVGKSPSDLERSHWPGTWFLEPRGRVRMCHTDPTKIKLEDETNWETLKDL